MNQNPNYLQVDESFEIDWFETFSKRENKEIGLASSPSNFLLKFWVQRFYMRNCLKYHVGYQKLNLNQFVTKQDYKYLISPTSWSLANST